MLSGLLLAGFLMGLAGVPHCATMCGAACAVAFPRGVSLWALAGRCTSYALLGGVAASSAGLASGLGKQFSFLQPFWVMAQCGVLGLGIWLLITARVPSWLEQTGQGAFHALRHWWRQRGAAVAMPWPWLGNWVAGMAWACLPCGLLYAAVMTSALAEAAWQGALVMLCFALPGAVAVWAAPAVLMRLRGRRPTPLAAGAPVPVVWMRQPADLDHAGAAPRAGTAKGACQGNEPANVGTLGGDDVRWAVRASGGLMALMSVYAIWHLLVAQWQAWCA